MTVTTRTQAPNYKIFEPDTLDAIYAKGLSDPIMGGINGAMGLMHGLASKRNQDTFNDQRVEYNKIAAALDKMEIDAKTKQEAMKMAVDMTKHGADSNDMPALAGILTPQGIARNDVGRMAGEKARKSEGGGAKEKENYKESRTLPDGRTVEWSSSGPAGSQPRVPTIDPTATTPVPTNSGNKNAQFQERAKAVGGPNGKAVVQGNTLVVTNPDTGKTYKFDRSGNEVK